MEAYEESITKRKEVNEMKDVWTAKLTDVEADRVNDRILDKMRLELSRFWDVLKELMLE